MIGILFALCFLLLLTSVFRLQFTQDSGKLMDSKNINISDGPIFLTPLMESGQLEKARDLAKVPTLLPGIESYAGFLTVNKISSSNLFFWLFQSPLANWEQQPLLVWMQGGPGASLSVGVFKEIGPFSVTKKLQLLRRKYSWAHKYNVLFFDQPVGSGFSFTAEDSGYPHDEFDVAKDLHLALLQIYVLFPALKAKLIIAGESHGSRFALATAHTIYKTNQVSEFKINLSGLVILSGGVDPGNMHGQGAYLYNLGLVDQSERDRLNSMEEEMEASIRAGKFSVALDQYSQKWREVMKVTGFKKLYDFMEDKIETREPGYTFIQSPKIRNAIHVGNLTFNSDAKIKKLLSNASMQSLAAEFEEFLTKEPFPILYVCGQRDPLVTYSMNRGSLALLKWPHAKDFHTARRCQFRVANRVAGYYKTAGVLTEFLMRNAGHFVAMSQPKWLFSVVDRFITNASSFICP